MELEQERTIWYTVQVGSDRLGVEERVRVVLVHEGTGEEDGEWKYFDLQLASSPLGEEWKGSHDEAVGYAQSKQKRIPPTSGTTDDEYQEQDPNSFWDGYDASDEEDEVAESREEEEAEGDDYWSKYDSAPAEEPPDSLEEDARPSPLTREIMDVELAKLYSRWMVTVSPPSGEQVLEKHNEFVIAVDSFTDSLKS